MFAYVYILHIFTCAWFGPICMSWIFVFLYSNCYAYIHRSHMYAHITYLYPLHICTSHAHTYSYVLLFAYCICVYLHVLCMYMPTQSAHVGMCLHVCIFMYIMHMCIFYSYLPSYMHVLHILGVFMYCAYHAYLHTSAYHAYVTRLLNIEYNIIYRYVNTCVYMGV